MSLPATVTAQPGDVIFLAGNDAASWASGRLQSRIDPDAASATRHFGHVAIAIGGLTALEAMPAEDDSETPEDTETGPWSGASLASGVRLIPIADLVVPAMRDRCDIVVLRYPAQPAPFLDGLGASYPAIAMMIGSAYSINLLKEQASTAFWPRLIDLAAPKLNWRSDPRDPASRMGLDGDLRQVILERFRDLDIPQAARSYFCSQLVTAVLKLSNLLTDDLATDLTTPTGLHVLLVSQGWTDMTPDYRCAPDADRYLAMTPTGTTASYLSSRAIAGMAAQSAGWSLESDILGAALAKMRSGCDEILGELAER